MIIGQRDRLPAHVRQRIVLLVIVATIFAVLAVCLNAYGQKQSGSLTNQKNSIGAPPAVQPVQLRALTEPQAPAVDQFKQGQISEHVDTLEFRITKVEDDMKTVLSNLNFLRGVWWFFAGAIVIAGNVLIMWWKRIVRALVKDVYAE